MLHIQVKQNKNKLFLKTSQNLSIHHYILCIFTNRINCNSKGKHNIIIVTRRIVYKNIKSLMHFKYA